MMMTKVCMFCANERSLEEFLRQDLQLSGQSLKKHGLSKKFLQKKITQKQEIELPLDLLNKDLVCADYQGPNVEILYEDEAFLVVDKPAGIHGHPLSYSDNKNVLSFLRSKGHFEVPALSLGGQEKGLLYRLDLETSGVLIGCKKASDYQLIRDQFDQHVVLKRYLCLVQGEGPRDGNYHFNLESYGHGGSKVRATQNPQAKATETTIKKISEHKGYSLCQVDLKTGARHQIRAVFQALGFPLLGDSLYGGANSDRLYLHAYEYRLKRESQKVLSFKSFPQSFRNHFLDLDRLLKMLHD